MSNRIVLCLSDPKAEPTSLSDPDDQVPVCEPAAGGGPELADEEELLKYEPSMSLNPQVDNLSSVMWQVFFPDTQHWF